MSCSNEEIWKLTVAYFKLKEKLGYPSEDTAAYGFRFGMAVALKHPEYAQAFVRTLSSLLSDAVEGAIVDEFINAVPLRGELEDVMPPR